MQAMVLNEICDLTRTTTPLTATDLPEPTPAPGELLIEVSACGVCHTELDEIEGRTPPPHFPVVLGHEVVGRVAALGETASGPGAGDASDPATADLAVGDRVGVGWIHSACGRCRYCRSGNENLCPDFKATGRDANGGYARFMTVPARFAYPIPDLFSDAEAAPLLCAGAVGYRSLRLAGLVDGGRIGLTGFGASGHLVLKMVRYRYPQAEVAVFARSEREQAFARELGAAWAGDIGQEAPDKLDCIIDTTPVWRPIVEALRNLAPGGRLVINAIRKEEVDKEVLLGLDYPTHLWLEKEIKSVANVARRDVQEFLQLAAEMGIKPEVEEFDLTDANAALMELKTARIRGAKVLRVD